MLVKPICHGQANAYECKYVIYMFLCNLARWHGVTVVTSPFAHTETHPHNSWRENATVSLVFPRFLHHVSPLQAFFLPELLLGQHLQEVVWPAMVVPRGKERTCIVFHGFAWLWKEHLKSVNFHGIIYLTISISVTLHLTSIISSQEVSIESFPAKSVTGTTAVGLSLKPNLAAQNGSNWRS